MNTTLLCFTGTGNSLAMCIPPMDRTIREIAGFEGVPYDLAAAAEIRIEQVHVFEGE